MKQKRKPIHAGDFFKRNILEAFDISVSKAAESMSIRPDHLYMILNGLRPVSIKIAVKFGRFSDTTAQSWINMQSKYDELIGAAVEEILEQDRQGKTVEYWDL